MPKKWLPAVVAVIVLAVGLLVFNVVRSNQATPSGKVAPVKPRMQDEAMRQIRMRAGGAGGVRP